MTPDLAPLFKPFRIKNVELRNRFVLPGMQRGWCVDGKPQLELDRYYQERVAGGAALIITESCAIDHDSATRQPAAGRICESTAEAWSRCIAAIKSTGGRVIIQLWHEGARSKSDDEAVALSPSGLIRDGVANGRAATLEELEQIRDAFARSAVLAREMGADGVEVHTCHGYLLDQFLWDQTNRRTDRYGGEDLADRLRFPAEVVEAVRQALGPEPLLSVRISQWKTVDYRAKIVRTPDELALLARTLEAAGADLFHASTRRFETPEWESSDLSFAGWFKAVSQRPVIAVGSVGVDADLLASLNEGQETQATGASAFQELCRRFGNGEFDLISVGRGQIGDPQWVAKVREGRFDEIRPFRVADLAPRAWDRSTTLAARLR